MASLTIYLDDETLRRVKSAARLEESSVSSWAQNVLAEAVEEKDANGWPTGYFEMIESWDPIEIEAPEDSPDDLGKTKEIVEALNEMFDEVEPSS